MEITRVEPNEKSENAQTRLSFIVDDIKATFQRTFSLVGDCVSQDRCGHIIRYSCTLKRMTSDQER